MVATIGSGPLTPQVAAAAAIQLADRLYEEKKTASALAPREVPKALIRAVRAELRALLDGDLEDNLTQVEQVAVRARELFMSIRGPGAQFTRGGLATPVVMNGAQVGTVSSYNTGLVFPQQSYSNPEQFGASAIRQLVALVPEIVSAQANTPDKLMTAIVLAEEKGHHDIAQALKKKLMGSDADASLSHEAHEAHEAHEVHESNGTSAAATMAVGAALASAGAAVMGAASQ
jgi:hypothetical protein